MDRLAAAVDDAGTRHLKLPDNLKLAPQVALVGLTESIRDVMTVTGFLDFFAAYDTLEEGVAALSQ